MVLDEIVGVGGTFEIIELNVGTRHEDESTARIKVTAEDHDALVKLIERLRQHGANPETVRDVTLEVADIDGSFPVGFYSTTNLETEIRVDGKWIVVRHPEMDCGIVVEGDGARTVPMGDVRQGMQIVMRGLGIRVLPLE